jgi:hypothetical protein
MTNSTSSKFDFLVVFEPSRSFLADEGCLIADNARSTLLEVLPATWTQSQVMPNCFTGTLVLANATQAEKRDEAMKLVSLEFQQIMNDLETGDAVVIDIALMVNRLGKAIEWTM